MSRVINRAEMVKHVQHLEAANPVEDNAEYVRGLVELAGTVLPVHGDLELDATSYRFECTGEYTATAPLTVEYDGDTLTITRNGNANLAGVNTIVTLVAGSPVLADDGDVTAAAATIDMANASVTLGTGALTEITLLEDAEVIAHWSGSITLATP